MEKLGYFSVCFQAWVANFEGPRMNANSLLASPTGLSPYLRFGCLSCRLFYFKLTDLYKKVLIKIGFLIFIFQDTFKKIAFNTSLLFNLR